MDEFKFDELKNFEVPESWIENALKLTPEKKKPKPVRLYRYAAVAAACVVLASAIGFTMMSGFNKDLKLTDPGNDTPGDSFTAGSTVDTTGDSDNQSVPTEKASGNTQNGTVVTTEPNEAAAGAVNDPTQKQQGAAQSNTKNKSAQAQPNGNTKTPSNVEKPAEPPADVTENAEPTEDNQAGNYPEPTIDDDFWHSNEGKFGAGGEYRPRPTETEAYGCHFATSVNRSAAQGNTYYCRIEDGSGNTLDSGTAQKYDWGNPSWPIDLQYTADVVLNYGETYTVTFYSSNGVTVWSGAVYLKEHQTNYLLY